MSDSHEAHTGPIKTPKQLLIAVLFSFLVPVFIIIALVSYVTSENKPAGDTEAAKYSLGGMTAQDVERGVAERIKKVGTVEIQDPNRPLKTGEEVFKAQCTTCHTAGVAGAPKFGDAAAWGPRIAQGFEALVNSALHGKNAMPAQGGGDFSDTEVARAVAYMANAGGAKFTEPAAPAAAAANGASAPAAAAAPAAAPAAGTAAPAAAAAAPAAAAPAAQAAAGAGAGQALYNSTCQVCHAAGVAGAPKFGDKAAWAPRIAQGKDALYNTALHGKGAMPPKGGSAAPDADVKAAVDYMVGAAK
ncbi:cytochrome c5 family protein [Ramlibacter sp. G-1-2-2]|uniref:Cytochrome c5 family protein n=1 Tax=Ramlibacter agri TaxID=2728837 RepID=A0A848HDA8_9BURK|nr:c-type cytochrome [Ramlibacter agri]NML48444.1 cytochrome c5 family protein [Ramlibacter agri]